jgi:hypothetical protein
LLFWKEAWLRRIEVQGENAETPASGNNAPVAKCTEQDLWSRTKIPASGESEPTYVCQNTQVKFATTPLQWWDIRQYVEDFTSGNVRISQLAAGLLYSLWSTVAESGLGVGWFMRWTYDRLQRATGGTPYPLRPFGVPEGAKTPTERLDLREGEVVRVKPYSEILNTLDFKYCNRGLYFDAEMVPFTERQYEVQARLKQIIDERTAKMVRLKTDAIVLRNVVCGARYAKCRLFCPRAIYPFWREIWLERARGARSSKT